MRTIVFTEQQRAEVSVMVKGKPTKKMKTAWIEVQIEREVEEVEIQGNIYFAKIDDKKYGSRLIYTADGNPVCGNFRYGKTGTANHIERLFINEKNQLITSGFGYSGQTGKGWGAVLINIIKG